MNEFDWGWSVGIIEGEGSFSVSRTAYGTYPRIEVVSTDESIVDRLYRLHGGHVNGPYEQSSALGSKPIYRWRLSKRQPVRELATKLLRHVTERRAEQIRSMLEAAA